VPPFCRFEKLVYTGIRLLLGYGANEAISVIGCVDMAGKAVFKRHGDTNEKNRIDRIGLVALNAVVCFGGECEIGLH